MISSPLPKLSPQWTSLKYLQHSASTSAYDTDNITSLTTFSSRHQPPSYSCYIQHCIHTLPVPKRRIDLKLASWFWKAAPSTSTATTHPSFLSQSTFLMASPKQPTSSMPVLSSPPTQPSGPQLTPQFCFNTRVLRDFLRVSRSQLDDTISTSLNSLLTPSTTSPFNPSSTSSPTTIRNQRTPIPQATCDQFINDTLLPSWANRTQVITYCSLVAASPDPDDPNLANIQADNIKLEHMEVNERLDPYSGRFVPREPRTEQLGALLRNESAVEGIVRARTWKILQDRCEGVSADGDRWEDALDKWRSEHGNK